MKTLIVSLSINEYEIEELKNLCKILNYEVVDVISQNLKIINTKYFIGSGKLKEIKLIIEEFNIENVVFNTELSYSQIRNIESIIETNIIDRSMLILNIFELRAKSKLAKIEIRNAKLKYMLPRIRLGKSDLSRQRGTSGPMGSKGAGESFIDLDKRKILNEISKNNKQIEIIKKQRYNSRSLRRKNETPIVSLVGYTNSGKSSTMNTILKLCNNLKEVSAKDMMFETFDTASRKVKLDNNDFILIDTVGFIENLPNHLIESFKSTLEEILESDFIIHVIDVSNPNYDKHISITNNILKEIGVTDIPILYLYNKADSLKDGYMIKTDNGFLFSNYTNINHNFLMKEIKKYISTETRIETFEIFYKDYKYVDLLLNKSTVLDIEYLDELVRIKTKINNNLFFYLKKVLN